MGEEEISIFLLSIAAVATVLALLGCAIACCLYYRGFRTRAIIDISNFRPSLQGLGFHSESSVFVLPLKPNPTKPEMEKQLEKQIEEKREQGDAKQEQKEKNFLYDEIQIHVAPEVSLNSSSSSSSSSNIMQETGVSSTLPISSSNILPIPISTSSSSCQLVPAPTRPKFGRFKQVV